MWNAFSLVQDLNSCPRYIHYTTGTSTKNILIWNLILQIKWYPHRYSHYGSVWTWSVEVEPHHLMQFSVIPMIQNAEGFFCLSEKKKYSSLKIVATPRSLLHLLRETAKLSSTKFKKKMFVCNCYSEFFKGNLTLISKDRNELRIK